MKGLLGPGDNKRSSFVIITVLSAIYVYLATFRLNLTYLYLVGATVLVSLITVLIINRPSNRLKDVPLSTILPFSSLFGTILFLQGFSNFTLVFKLMVILGFMAVYYPIVLSLNIFLFVSEKGSIIPLYRVASTWNQILLSLVSIPLFAGVLKFDLYSIYIAGIVFFITFSLNLYHLWAIRLDPEARKTRIGDLLLLSSLSAFLVFCSVTGLSFIPSEAFLIALTASSMLMFTLTYSGGYLRNDITKKSSINNLLIVAFFALMTALLS